MQFVDKNLTAIHGATFWVMPLITYTESGTGSSTSRAWSNSGTSWDRTCLVLSVEHLNIGIRTSWISDRFRTLEFATLSLDLLFESLCPTTADDFFVDDIIAIDRETLAMVVDLLEHQYLSS
ncbi:hypothetical protein [Natrinema versiforme]|uniref:hypothetical protein n=1 Tax=Natrinema versiforme TaxID=88724 RepID=UPI00158608D9